MNENLSLLIGEKRRVETWSLWTVNRTPKPLLCGWQPFGKSKAAEDCRTPKRWRDGVSPMQTQGREVYPELGVETRHELGLRRLETCDTAGWKPALQ